MKKKFIMTLGSILALTLPLALSSADAQAFNPNYSNQLGNSITREYDMLTLRTRKAIVEVGKDNATILDFPDTVTEVISPDKSLDGILKVEVLDNLVMLSTESTRGAGPLIVRLANRDLAFFQVKITPTADTKYVVMTYPDKKQAEVQEAPPVAAAPAVLPPLNVSLPQTEAKGSLPDWLKVNYTLQKNGTEVGVQYTVNNLGQTPMTLAEDKLSVSLDGKYVPFKIVRLSSGTVGEKSNDYGVIVIPNAVGKALSLIWRITDTAGVAYNSTNTFDLGESSVAASK